MLSLPRLSGYTVRQVEEVVRLNDKQRFTLKKDSAGGYLIRANQGHTIKVTEALKNNDVFVKNESIGRAWTLD